MEITEYSRFFLALAFVIGLIWLAAHLVKRSGLDKKLRGVSGQHGRLAVVDVLYLDPRRKLTLIRADSNEYLLLIAGDSVQVIDTLKAKHETVA